MKQLPRPPFPFSGAWLEAGGLTLHLIADDPTIPRKEARKHWKACSYSGALSCCLASASLITDDPAIPGSLQALEGMNTIWIPALLPGSVDLQIHRLQGVLSGGMIICKIHLWEECRMRQLQTESRTAGSSASP